MAFFDAHTEGSMSRTQFNTLPRALRLELVQSHGRALLSFLDAVSQVEQSLVAMGCSPNDVTDAAMAMHDASSRFDDLFDTRVGAVTIKTQSSEGHHGAN